MQTQIRWLLLLVQDLQCPVSTNTVFHSSQILFSFERLWFQPTVEKQRDLVMMFAASSATGGSSEHILNL